MKFVRTDTPNGKIVAIAFNKKTQKEGEKTYSASPEAIAQAKKLKAEKGAGFTFKGEFSSDFKQIVGITYQEAYVPRQGGGNSSKGSYKGSSGGSNYLKDESYIFNSAVLSPVNEGKDIAEVVKNVKTLFALGLELVGIKKPATPVPAKDPTDDDDATPVKTVNEDDDDVVLPSGDDD